jgi:4-amino-4-deoxy-L-arabinose transferase-like glycosyltransferase
VSEELLLAARPRRALLESLERRWLALAATLVLALFAGLVIWNVYHYDWLRGYDAWALSRYTDALRVGHHLPAKTDTDVWHNPPLFFFLAALLQGLAARIGWPHDPHQLVQLFDALCVIGVAAFAFPIARELFPRSRGAQLSALALAAATPVLLRAGALYHPEPLAALLTAAALWLAVRAFARERSGLRAGLWTGLLVGLACLTRTWALALVPALLLALVVDWRFRSGRRALVMAAAFLALFALTNAPWLAYKGVRFGNPLAYSQPNPSQWRQHGRPLSFYVGFPVSQVFRTPYDPHYRNELLPVVYSDWWGDYWRYFGVPASEVGQQGPMPSHEQHRRAVQSWLGIVPTLLALAGLATLCVAAWRRRSAALTALVGSILLLGLAYALFLVKYPKQDGDNIKALYLLNWVAPLAVCAGFALSRLLRLHRLIAAGAVLGLLELLYLSLQFEILH